MRMGSSIDILGVGCVAVDDLLYVADYPAADGKTQVLGRERHCGGLVEGLDLAARVRLAAATAALSATRSGGQAGIPVRRAVQAFLEEHAR